MAGGLAGHGLSTPGVLLLNLVQHVICTSAGTNLGDVFEMDFTDLVRPIALLSHIFEEIRDLLTHNEFGVSDASTSLPFSKLATDEAVQKIEFQFKYVTWKLEKALGNLPFPRYDISEEVQEQVELARAQLRRAAKKYGSPCSITPSVLSQLLDQEISILLADQWLNGVPFENYCTIDDDVTVKMDTF